MTKVTKDSIKECRIHGLTVFGLQKQGKKQPRWYCRKCQVDDVNRRRRKLKVLAIQYLGGQCQICKYSKCIDALEFHHTDPNEKEFGISAKGYTRSWEKVKQELDKCTLLCANCHAEAHADNISHEYEKLPPIKIDRRIEIECVSCNKIFKLLPHVYKLRKNRNIGGYLYCSKSCNMKHLYKMGKLAINHQVGGSSPPQPVECR